MNAFLKKSTPKRCFAFALALLICLASLPVLSLNAGATGESTTESTPESSADETAQAQAEEETAGVTASLLVTGTHTPYMSGVDTLLFKPDKVLTRAEAAQILYNLLETKPDDSTGKFSDVSSSAWYSKAVNALAGLGVLSGYPDGTFLPNKSVSRAEFVCMVMKCFTVTMTSSESFTDVSDKHWAYSYISTAYSLGWVSGYGDGTFAPDNTVLRCEAVCIMNGALGRTGDGFAAYSAKQRFTDVPTTHWAYKQISEATQDASSPTVAESSGNNNGSGSSSGGSSDNSSDNSDSSSSESSGGYTVGGSAKVLVDDLTLRSGASTSSSAITWLSKGTIVTVTKVSDLPWLGVKLSSGSTGYINVGTTSNPYVEPYGSSKATVSGAAVSNSTISMKRYQSARLDGSISSGSLSSMKWTSSDSSVAYVAYTLSYGSSTTLGAIIYGAKPGTATITFTDSTGEAKASCTVTVTQAASVRFAYAGENCASIGQSFDLIAVTDTDKSAVTFSVTGGKSYTTGSYTEESRSSSYGLPTNKVRVFKQTVSFSAAGTYTVRASSGGSDYCEFTVFVQAGESDVNKTGSASRRCSTEGLKIIANFEGGVPEIEDDTIASGNPTVGYGTVISKGEAFYNNLTTTELFAFLVKTVNEKGYATAVNNFRSKNNLLMSQAQFDALVSFVFNCGSGALSGSYTVIQTMLNAVVPPEMSESKSYSGKLNICDVTMYEEASLSSTAVTTIKEDSTVTLIGYSMDEKTHRVWYKAKYNDKTGWIPAGYVSVDTSGLVHDLAYADATAVAYSFLQWHHSGSSCITGLLWRRLAECKIFFFGNYSEAYHSNSNYSKNTYSFVYPSCEKKYQ